MLHGVALSLIEELKRPDDTSHIVRVYEFSRSRVPALEECIYGLVALVFSHLLIALARLGRRIALREDHIVYRGIKVESRTTAEDGELSFRAEAIDAAARFLLEELRRIGIANICDIDHKERTPAFRYRCLCCADIHAAIDLHRIDRDDGGCKTACQLICKRALARCSRAYDAEDAVAFHRGSPVCVPSRYQDFVSSTFTSTSLPTRSSAFWPSRSGK